MIQAAEVRDNAAMSISEHQHQIVAEFDRLKRDGLSAVGRAVKMGQHCIAIRAALPFGNWQAWCRVHLPFSPRHAERYIALAAKVSKKGQAADLFYSLENEAANLTIADFEARLRELIEDGPEPEKNSEEPAEKQKKDPLKEWRKLWDKAVRSIDEFERLAGCLNSAEGNEQRERLQEWREWMESLYRSRS